MKSESLLPAQQRPIAEYMLPAEATVHEHAPLTEVIDALILSPLKRVIVIDEAEQIKGIISDVDVLAHMQAESRPQLVHLLTRWTRSSTRRPSGVLRAVGKTQTAADVMNPEVVAVTESTTAQETIEQMMATGRKVLPIRDAEGRLKGIIGRSDLLRILLEA
jgi:CBS domain-containing protein